MATEKKTSKKKTTKPITLPDKDAAVIEAPSQKKVGTPKEPTFTQDQVQAMIAEVVAKATAQMQAAQTPQIVQVVADTEKVQFLWQAEVADENVYEIGPNGMYGRIVGKTGSFYVPKSDLSRVMDSMFRLLLQKRWIIAVDGLTEDERVAYGVDYKDGETLDKNAFMGIIGMGDEILRIYPRLCAGHREMVAKRFHEAYANGDPRVTREIVVALNRISKKYSKDGDFTDIIEAMNEEDAKK